jgi:S1-C subfamily serine protease
VPRLAAAALALALSAGDARGDGLASVEAEQQELFERVAPSTVVISGGGALGAGFAVAPSLLLTAAHVVGTGREVTVALRDGRVVRGAVEEVAAGDVDAALVRIPASLPPLDLADAAALRAGSVVASVGHPDGDRWTLATGLVAQDPADSADRDVVRLQLPLRPGASGGPVVDRSGRVVALVTTGAPGTVAYGLRSEAAVRALAVLRQSAALARAQPAEDRPTP